MHNKNTFPIVDHGVDIIGDEWDEEGGEMKEVKIVKLEKRYDPKHPYCTNWPVSDSTYRNRVQKGEEEKD